MATSDDAAAGGQPAELRIVPQRTGAGGDPSSEELGHALTALRARIDEEFRITESLNSKQRQAFGLAAGFFAVIQAVAFGSFAVGQIDSREKALVGAFAIAAAVVLAWTGVVLSQVEEIRRETDVLPSAIVRWCNESTGKGDVTKLLISRLAGVAESRAKSNVARQDGVMRVQLWARATLMLSAVELILGIVVRLG